MANTLLIVICGILVIICLWLLIKLAITGIKRFFVGMLNFIFGLLFFISIAFTIMVITNREYVKHKIDETLNHPEWGKDVWEKLTQIKTL